MIDTFNEFGVSMAGDNVIMLRAPGSMTKPQAIRLAAWLVALADYGNDHSFEEVRTAVENT